MATSCCEAVYMTVNREAGKTSIIESGRPSPVAKVWTTNGGTIFIDSPEISMARITTSTMSEKQVLQDGHPKARYEERATEARRRRASGDLSNPETRQRRQSARGRLRGTTTIGPRRQATVRHGDDSQELVCMPLTGLVESRPGVSETTANKKTVRRQLDCHHGCIKAS